MAQLFDDDDSPRDPLFDQTTERDLRRVRTNHLFFPPPSDPNDPLWDSAWSEFERVYTPALCRFMGLVLRDGGPDRAEDPEDIAREFICSRLRGGQLSPADDQPIRSFRGWLATQARCFALDRLGHQTALKRFPHASRTSQAVLESLPDTRVSPRALAWFSEWIVQEIMTATIARVRERSETYALIVEDLTRNAGYSSADIAEQLGVKPHRLADLRRRAREAFREELLAMARLGIFSEEDLEEFIRVLRRWFGPRRD